MGKEVVKIKDWPFHKREKARLIWIGEPFKQDNKFMVLAYFKGIQSVKRVTLDWGSVHFLGIDRFYVDGNLNHGKAGKLEEIIDIQLDVRSITYNERDWIISGIGDQTTSKTWNAFKDGIHYTIPVIEVIRGILAPDQFTLYRILETDNFCPYLMYELENKKLTLYFSPEYSKELIKNDKILHFAWILTNPNVLKMFNQLGENMWLKRQFLFDFGFETFNFKARVSRKGNRVRVLEILGFKNKRIFADEIEIYHAGMKMAESSQEPKKRKYINLSNDKDESKELLSDVDGSIDNSELIETNKIIHEYENFPIIKRIKNKKEKKRIHEDDQTKVLYIQSNNLRTTADSGGMETLKGLEFDSLESVTVKGELQQFIELLKLLEKRSEVIHVTIIKGVLPEGLKERKYSKLSDGITQRKYIIGKLLLNDGREFSLIEIEREDKSLSMLMLQSYGNVNWLKIYSSLLLGLVNESGKWSNKVLNEIENRGIIITRLRHLNKNIYEKEKYIYEKIYCSDDV